MYKIYMYNCTYACTYVYYTCIYTCVRECPSQKMGPLGF